MKLLLVLDDPRRAQSLVDYLTELGIHCELTLDDAQQASIWLVDESRLTDAEREVKQFIAEPLHPRYQAASWRHGDTQMHFARTGQPGVLSNMLRRTGLVNMLVLLSCVLIYVLQMMGAPIYAQLAFPSHLSQLIGVDAWRGFTPVLLHFSIMHLVFNLFWWWYLASMIEARLGRGKLIVLLLVAALIPNILQFVVSGPHFGGLSGVVYALLAYVWLFGKLNPGRGIGLPDGMAIFMVVWLILGFAGVLGPVANLAHLGGGLIGLLQAWLDKTKQLH